MALFRCILPTWASEKFPERKKVIEGEFNEEQILSLNEQFYNIYYLPNYPSIYSPNSTIDGSQIDTFSFVFVDFDLKDKIYKSKQDFIEYVKSLSLDPAYIIDSGNGIHVYWHVSDLDAKSYLRFERRLMRLYRTDEAVGQLFQLMRAPNTVNTKFEDSFKLCEQIYEGNSSYTCEQLDKLLPSITLADEEYCKNHYDRTHGLSQNHTSFSDTLPMKFGQLIQTNQEVKEIWSGDRGDDRSKNDFRLGHIMMAHGFTKEEATSVLVNTAKALQRSPTHRYSYATNIIDKIWTFDSQLQNSELDLSMSIKDILQKPTGTLGGSRFSCWSYLDNTDYGFRLGHVIGLVAGSGVGKTAVALNMFQGFVTNNPEYDHFFIPLEQPSDEIAQRWKSMCGERQYLYDKVHVISNYDENGAFRHLSFNEIKEYILKFQRLTKRKVGCIVIDHIGALKKKGKEGENQDLMSICHEMKAFAIETNTLLVMQSQAPREKAGIGDLELNKDAAYGTVYFESYCDYLITIWQPLKRVYEEGAPTVTAFKFCKIRHKKQGKDKIKEDICYNMMFDSETEYLREMTEDEEKSFNFFLSRATNKRKGDRKTDLVKYTSVKWSNDGKVDNNSHDSGASST